MEEKERLIERLGLVPHREGGYFRELFYGERKEGRNLFSSILFLLGEGDTSHLHVLQEDELWYFHDGEDCSIYEIFPDGRLQRTLLGRNSGCYQHLVRKGTIFGSRREGKGFTLVGCMVAPAFTYDHFRLVRAEDLPPMREEDRILVQDLLLPPSFEACG